MNGVLSASTQSDLDQELQAILDRYNQEGYSPYGITGDPDCPFRDWRGTPLEVGAHVVYAVGGGHNPIVVAEGEVISISEKPDKKKSNKNWKFTMTVHPIKHVSHGSNWYAAYRNQQSEREPEKKVTIQAVERVTVIF